MSSYKPGIYIRDYEVADERIFVLHAETASSGRHVPISRTFRVAVGGPNSGVLLLEPDGGSLLLSGQNGARLRFTRLGQTVSRSGEVRVIWNYVRVQPGRTVSRGQAVRVGRILRIEVLPAGSTSDGKPVAVSRSFRIVASPVGTRAGLRSIPVRRHFAVSTAAAHSQTASAQAHVRFIRRVVAILASSRSRGQLTPVQRIFRIAAETTSTVSQGHTVQVIFGTTSDPALRLSGTVAGSSNTADAFTGQTAS